MVSLASDKKKHPFEVDGGVNLDISVNICFYVHY